MTAPTDPAGAAADESAGTVALDELVALARRIQDVSIAAGRTVALAESCTGGLVTHVLTEVPGSSAYLLGGIVSYADAAKAALLGVPAETLRAHGAVSAQVASAMADGARSRFAADVAAAVTGIAGPGGGSDAKPVGLTYVAVADGEGHEVRRFLWPGDRSANKVHSAQAVLHLLLERLERAAGGAGRDGA